MIYLKIKQDQSIEYPYSVEKLKQDNPNTSFPEDISEELLVVYGVYPVIFVNHDNDYTKNYTEAIPVLVDGKYYQNWVATDATEQEIDERLSNQWIVVRYQRNQYLSESDWTQLSDSPLTTEQKQEWASYRQQLRDVTTQPDPFNIAWPIKPQ